MSVLRNSQYVSCHRKVYRRGNLLRFLISQKHDKLRYSILLNSRERQREKKEKKERDTGEGTTVYNCYYFTDILKNEAKLQTDKK